MKTKEAEAFLDCQSCLNRTCCCFENEKYVVEEYVI